MPSELNLPLEIASEERESQLAYLVSTLGKPNFAVIDNGSRSIELVTRTRQTGISGMSLIWAIGLLFEQFFEPAKSFADAHAGYSKALAGLSYRRHFYEEPRRIHGR